MYNVSAIKSGLIGLIGWRQNADPNGQQLKGLLSTETGRYYNDEHALITFDNLLSIAPEFERITYQAWSSSKTYALGDLVQSNQIIFKAKQAHTNQTPDPNSDTDYWAVHDPFTNWIQEKTEAGIIKTIDTWFAEKSNLDTATNLIETNTVFTEKAGFQAQSNTNKRVGLEICLPASRGARMEVEKISLQFSENQTITIKLFESGNQTAIKSENLVYTGAGSIEWHSLTGWTLEGNKNYWIVYDQTAITGTATNAIETANNFTRIANYPNGKFITISAFETTEAMTSLWEVNKNAYSIDSNYGLNFTYSVRCDYTDFIIDQKNIFANAIAKNVAISILRELAYNANTRINRNEKNINRNEILFEIEGDTQGREGGLILAFTNALKSISFDKTQIDSMTLPVRNRGVHYSSI